MLAAYGYGLLGEVNASWVEASQRYEEAVIGFERLGTPVWVGIALAGQGRCAEAIGDLAAAGEHFENALALGRRLGEPSVTAASLEGLGRLARARGEHEYGERMSSEAAHDPRPVRPAVAAT